MALIFEGLSKPVSYTRFASLTYFTIPLKASLPAHWLYDVLFLSHLWQSLYTGWIQDQYRMDTGWV